MGSDTKVAKILLVLVYLVLLCFAGLGVYAWLNGMEGPGKVGIGMFLIGAGITGFLQSGLFTDAEASSSSRPKPKKSARTALFSFPGTVAFPGQPETDCVVSLYDDTLELENLPVGKVVVPRSDMVYVGRSGNVLSVSYNMPHSSSDAPNSIRLTADNPLRLKALEQSLRVKQ